MDSFACSTTTKSFPPYHYKKDDDDNDYKSSKLAQPKCMKEKAQLLLQMGKFDFLRTNSKILQKT
jgi:hypothetical protein